MLITEDDELWLGGKLKWRGSYWARFRPASP